MALGSAQETFAEDPTRSDRDLRLADMIACAQRITFWIKEYQHALLLIFVKETEGNREGRSDRQAGPYERSEEHTSELQSLMRISYAVFCLKKKKEPSILYKI